MPSVSKAQMRMMAAIAHNPRLAKKLGVPMKVAREFHEADRAKGGSRLPEHKTKQKGK